LSAHSTEAGREWDTLAEEESRVHRNWSTHHTEAGREWNTLPGEVRTQKLVSTPNKSWEGMGHTHWRGEYTETCQHTKQKLRGNGTHKLERRGGYTETCQHTRQKLGENGTHLLKSRGESLKHLLERRLESTQKLVSIPNRS
jgi:hypothetical protein